MFDIIDGLWRQPSTRPWIGTFHSGEAGLLEKRASKIKQTSTFSPLQSQQRGVCGFKVLAKSNASDVGFSALGTEISHLLVSSIRCRRLSPTTRPDCLRGLWPPSRAVSTELIFCTRASYSRLGQATVSARFRRRGASDGTIASGLFNCSTAWRSYGPRPSDPMKIVCYCKSKSDSRDSLSRDLAKLVEAANVSIRYPGCSKFFPQPDFRSALRLSDQYQRTRFI